MLRARRNRKSIALRARVSFGFSAILPVDVVKLTMPPVSVSQTVPLTSFSIVFVPADRKRFVSV